MCITFDRSIQTFFNIIIVTSPMTTLTYLSGYTFKNVVNDRFLTLNLLRNKFSPNKFCF